jgi:hypothetical protein
MVEPRGRLGKRQPGTLERAPQEVAGKRVLEEKPKQGKPERTAAKPGRMIREAKLERLVVGKRGRIVVEAPRERPIRAVVAAQGRVAPRTAVVHRHQWGARREPGVAARTRQDTQATRRAKAERIRSGARAQPRVKADDLRGEPLALQLAEPQEPPMLAREARDKVGRQEQAALAHNRPY